MVKTMKDPEFELSEIDKCIIVLEYLAKGFLLDSEREATIAAHFRPRYIEKLKAHEDHDGHLLFHYVMPHEHYAKVYADNAEYLTKVVAMLQELILIKEI